jgi:hypothetical protein
MLRLMASGKIQTRRILRPGFLLGHTVLAT